MSLRGYISQSYKRLTQKNMYLDDVIQWMKNKYNDYELRDEGLVWLIGAVI